MSLDVQKTALTFRSPFYLECERKFGCIICQKIGQRPKGHTEIHHTGGRGKAGEGSDIRTVPVDRQHHPQSPKGFVIMCRELGLDVDTLVAETQARFCFEQGYDIQPFLDREHDPMEELLVEAGLGAWMDVSHRVSRKTAKSKSKKLSKFRPLSKKTGTPDHPLS